MNYDVLVIGAGVDALVAAATLAKEGRKVLVLERREVVGGRAVTEELHPGFKVSPTLHGYGGLLPQVVRSLELERHGLDPIPEDRGVTTLRAGGKPFHLPAEPVAAEAACARLSEKDGQGYVRLTAFLERIGAFLKPLLTLQPVPFKRPPLTELLEPAWQAIRLRRLGQQDMMELLRIGPQCVNDFAEDWFRDETLRATIALPALIGTQAGPRSPGTVANLLLWEASSFGAPLCRGGLPKGGMGAVADALKRAAEHYKVVIRTGAAVARILCDGDRATGVALEGGEEITARVVLSGVSPRATFLEMLGPRALGPTLRQRLNGYRSEGCAAKVHFALDALPDFRGEVELGGRVQIGERLDDLERAFDATKYGRISEKPFLDVAFPSVLDPSLAPSGKHVASVLVQYAPYSLRDGEWEQERDRLGDLVQQRLEEHAPGFGERIVAREVLSPRDLEARFGLAGGHLFGGDLALDQLFTNRPTPECGSYRTPIANLYLTGAGTHPGGHITGAAGANAARRMMRDWKAIVRRGR